MELGLTKLLQKLNSAVFLTYCAELWEVLEGRNFFETQYSIVITVLLHVIARYYEGPSVRLSLSNACIVTKRKKLVPTFLCRLKVRLS